jgi:hypothetical protein
LWNKNKGGQFEKARRKSREDGCGYVGKEKKMHADD